MSHRRIGTHDWARRASLALLLLSIVLAAPARSDVLSGVLRDPNGNPVGNADFDVFDLDGNKLPDEANSDSDGTYDLNLARGVWDIVCQPVLGGGLAPAARRGIRIEGDRVLDWTLPPAIRVLGRIRGPGGRPIAGVKLDFDRLDDGARQPVLGNVTNAFGNCAVSIEAGSYRVTATPPDSTDLAPVRTSERTLGGLDTLDFALEFAVHLDARVADVAGAPVPAARIVFERSSDGARMPAWGNLTDAEGRCRAGVAAGEYRVVAEPPPGTRLVARRVIAVSLGEDASLDLALETGFVVTGEVRDPRGLPLAAADWDAALEPGGTSVPTPYDNTDGEGRFRLVLPAGTLRLTLTPPAGSGLDTLVLEDVVVSGDTTMLVRYDLPGPAGGSRLRLEPLVSPVHRSGAFVLTLEREESVRLELFDVTGRRVRVLRDGIVPRGAHVVPWDGRNDSGGASHTGVYFARARTAAGAAIARIILLP